jgi:hypothetical protein
MAADFSRLKILGATADRAVECMREKGVMPAKPHYKEPSQYTVELREDGALFVDEIGRNEGVMSAIKPADRENPAAMITPEVSAVGPGVERLRQKAIACAVKGIAGP